MKFTKKDLFATLVTGLYTGAIAWQVLNFLEAPSLGLPGPHPHSLFLIIVPVVWILGVNLGYFLGRWMGFFNQFGKFCVIGFANFAVSWGLLNLLIAKSDITSGIWYSVFVGVAFIGGALHSYGWNKFWVFESTQKSGTEFLKFFVVNGLGGLINIAVASLIVNWIGARFGLSLEVWANVGSILGSAAALIFSFFAFRFIVFKKKDNVIPQI